MRPPRTSRWITIAALALLMGVVAYGRQAFSTSSTNMWDSVDYAKSVERLLAEGWLVRFDTIELDHPLYAYLVAALHRLVGLFAASDVLHSCKLFGVIMATLALPPLLWLARWLFASSGWALLTIVLFAVNPLSWWWASEVMTDTAGVTFMLWSLGLAARWAEHGSARSLAAGSLVLGFGALLRIGVLLIGPAFLAIAAMGMIRHRRVKPGLVLLLLPLPPLAFVLLQTLAHGVPISSFVELTPQNTIDRSLATTPAHWLKMGGMVWNGLGPVAAALAALGLVVAAARHPRLFALALLWLGPVVFVEATNADTVIRYYLPLMPLAALLAVAFCRSGLAPLPHGSDAVGAVCGLVLTATVLNASPNLIALRDARSALDAAAAWYRDHAPTDALIVGMADYNHVRYFSNHPVIRYHPDVVGKPWESEPDQTPLTLEATLGEIRAALLTKRPVFASDVTSEKDWRNLVARLVLAPVATLGSEDDPVRNARDPGFSMMNEVWRDDLPVTIYRVTAVTPPPSDAENECP